MQMLTYYGSWFGSTVAQEFLFIKHAMLMIGLAAAGANVNNLS